MCRELFQNEISLEDGVNDSIIVIVTMGVVLQFVGQYSVRY